MIDKTFSLENATLHLAGQDLFRCSAVLMQSPLSDRTSRFLLVGTLVGNDEKFGDPLSILYQICVLTDHNDDSAMQILNQFIDWIAASVLEDSGVDCEEGLEWSECHWLTFSLTRL